MPQIFKSRFRTENANQINTIMELDFINELCESRLVRTKKQIKKFTAKDAADLTFLYACTLVILKNEFKYAPIAMSYATKTKMFSNWNVFRTNGTDMYVLLNSLIGTDDTNTLFSDQEASQVFRNSLKINQPQLKAWLAYTGKGKVDRTIDGQFLYRLERQLRVDNAQYKAIRRLSVDWPNLKHGQRTLIITRTMQAFRMRARRSEFMPILMKLSKERKYIPVNKKGKIVTPKNMELKHPAGTKGCMSTRSKIAIGIGLPIATGIAGYALGRRVGSRRTSKRQYST